MNFVLLPLLVSASLGAGQGPRRLEEAGPLNNQKIAKIRDEIVSTLEVKISRMNSSSVISGPSLVRELLGAISDTTGIAPPLVTLAALDGSVDALALLAVHRKMPTDVDHDHDHDHDGDDDHGGKSATEEADGAPDADKADAHADHADAHADNADTDTDDADADAAAPLELLLNNTVLSKIRDRLVGDLETRVSSMNATATMTAEEVVADLLDKIADLTGVSPDILGGGGAGEGDAAPVLSAGWDAGAARPPYAHPALAFCAGIASTVAAVGALAKLRRARAARGVQSGRYEEFGQGLGRGGSGLAEEVLRSERERLARV